MTPSLAVRRLIFDEPENALQWLSAAHSDIALDLEVAQVFALVGLAALARQERAGGITVAPTPGSKASEFAHAVGLSDVVSNHPHDKPGEPGRTVKLTRVAKFGEIEPQASAISRLLIAGPDQEDTRLTIYYVLVELLRNVVQHSCDPLGGVVAAQLMDRGATYEDRPAVQIAVADNGVGIPATLRGLHPALTDPGAALEKAIHPHISGTFEEGFTRTQHNAGMGLFFIAEMAKLSAGRLLIASRGASLLLRGDPEGEERHQIRLLAPEGLGFPGTLVAFELPIDGVQDYEGLISAINDRARARAPKQRVQPDSHWFRYDPPPPEARTFLVKQTAEDTVAAALFAKEQLLPRLTSHETLTLDFRGLRICTQSYLHALLYEPLRVAWALRVPIYVANATEALKGSLTLLESYGLPG